MISSSVLGTGLVFVLGVNDFASWFAVGMRLPLELALAAPVMEELGLCCPGCGRGTAWEDLLGVQRAEAALEPLQ